MCLCVCVCVCVNNRGRWENLCTCMFKHLFCHNEMLHPANYPLISFARWNTCSINTHTHTHTHTCMNISTCMRVSKLWKGQDNTGTQKSIQLYTLCIPTHLGRWSPRVMRRDDKRYSFECDTVTRKQNHQIWPQYPAVLNRSVLGQQEQELTVEASSHCM